MPERPLTIAGYAAGASLAAITLVYVFGPTFFLDDEAANSSKSTRKKGVVGLSNPANDCFINSVLQALAGLPELRIYLIREVHRRKLDGLELYQDITAALEEEQRMASSKEVPEWKLLGLQQGLVTAGLKDILDALNERPIYKKTISAQQFIRVVETSFRTRVNRTQQDAQEFLQVVAERLADEHYAARRVRRRARQKHHKVADTQPPQSDEKATHAAGPELGGGSENESVPDAPMFPFEGKMESQIECSHCHFEPKPSKSSFATLTLNVPHNANSTSLNACLDGLLKIEHIDDFICDRCRLEHAISVYSRNLARPGLSATERSEFEQAKKKLDAALEQDPEKPPKDVKLPNSSTAPKRRISRHTRISVFPRILAIHLNRSVWDPYSSSTKNMSKVPFPETLPLGGLLDRKIYQLRTVVTHKGGHNSGHYETFRRQMQPQPFSTPASMGSEGIYSVKPTPANTPGVSAAPSPRVGARPSRDLTDAAMSDTPPGLVHFDLESPSTSSASSRSLQLSAADNRRRQVSTSVPLDAMPTNGLPEVPAQPGPRPPLGQPKRSGGIAKAMDSLPLRKRKPHERWWRISDEKVKESKTSEVLGMQREIYLLFYELLDDTQT